MDLLLGTGVALLLTLVGYVHYRIPFHTAGASRVLLTRGVLALVGLALGAVMALSYGADYPSALLVFLAGFGAVHFPAAVILFVKHARGSGRT
jgi:hypothetical protein